MSCALFNAAVDPEVAVGISAGTNPGTAVHENCALLMQVWWHVGKGWREGEGAACFVFEVAGVLPCSCLTSIHDVRMPSPPPPPARSPAHLPPRHAAALTSLPPQCHAKMSP